MQKTEQATGLSDFPDLHNALLGIVELINDPKLTRELVNLRQCRLWFNQDPYIYFQVLAGQAQTTVYPLRDDRNQRIGYGISQTRHLGGDCFSRQRFHAIDINRNKIPAALSAHNPLLAIQLLDGQRRLVHGLHTNPLSQPQPTNIFESEKLPTIMFAHPDQSPEKVEYWTTIPSLSLELGLPWRLQQEIWRKIGATQTHVVWNHTPKMIDTPDKPQNGREFYQTWNNSHSAKLRLHAVVVRRLGR